MRGKIYIGNLNENVRKSELRHEFEKFGEIADLFVNHGFAHLTFVDSRSSHDAIRIMDGEMFFGNKLRVEMSQDSHSHHHDAGHNMSRRSRGYSPPSRHGEFQFRGGNSRGGGRSHDIFNPRRSTPPHSGYGREPSPPPHHVHRRDEYYSRRNSPPPLRYRSRSPIPHRYSSSHRMSSPSRSHIPPRDNYGPPQRNFSNEREYRGRGGSYSRGSSGNRYQDDYRSRDFSRHSDRDSNGLSRGYETRKSRGRGDGGVPRSFGGLPSRDRGSRSFGGPSRDRGDDSRDDHRRFSGGRDSDRDHGGPPRDGGYRSRGGPPRGAPRSRGRFMRGR